MQNIEFKAELRDIELARNVCEHIKATSLGFYRQADTYYRMPEGRLKRRETEGRQPEWIFYHRDNLLTAKSSQFTILSDLQARTRWGADRLTPWLSVNKRREVWHVDNTRIHLDDVEHLGRFIEFESRVSLRYNVRECRMIVKLLREKFAHAMGEPISLSYCDLMDQELSTRS